MPDPSLLLPMLALLLAIGAFAGIIAGLLGVGGGLILVPAYLYAFEALGYGGPGLMRVCLATSLATIIVTSLRSVHAHHGKGAVDLGILRQWGPWIALGAVAGTLAASGLRSGVLQAIFGTVGVAVGLYMAFGRASWRLGEHMPRGAARGATGTGMGFLSVLMGIGGGTFGVPLMSLFNVPIHRAVATAAGFGVIIALPSALLFLLTPTDAAPPWTVGSVNLPAFGITIATTLLTAPLGVRLAHAMDPKPLKRVFAVFIMIVALNMLRKAAGY
ncbi:sulfite exporter TauE/SafE family protein [Cereibacter sediminicola]|uniref:sulfite exporter TauE/SafE family protein n=1 Tax=Cereibacter sediminicola TaxID=2584941 RepID=UPI0011A8D2C4|nr:sulfite exporter TauE/SafE family protein [Cereibacter sediminicola]